MFVRFIGHAGIFLEEGETTLLIDPWFNDSSLENPILESLTGLRTIDFQIPKVQEKISDYHPDVIAISHFHPHHSPLRDIRTLIRQTKKPLSILHPQTERVSEIERRIQDLENYTRHSLADKESFRAGSLRITALAHTSPDHLAWFVQSPSGSVLHIADARIHKDRLTRERDPLWETFSSLKPDLVFISAGRNSKRAQAVSERIIYENMGLSPIEAARVLQLIQPKAVSLMGTHNHSIWKNRIEHISETPVSEEEFHWALEWLAPKTRLVRARSRHTYSIREKREGVDTYIE